MKLIRQKLEGWDYCTVKIAWSQLQPFLTDPPVWRTDGRTDGRTGECCRALKTEKVVNWKVTQNRVSRLSVLQWGFVWLFVPHGQHQVALLKVKFIGTAKLTCVCQILPWSVFGTLISDCSDENRKHEKFRRYFRRIGEYLPRLLWNFQDLQHNAIRSL